jgi:5-methylcytosine-specific restriction enzyme subunit McrC
MISIREGTTAEVELTGEQAAALAASRIVQMAPGARAGLWRVQDNGLVGAARLAGVEVRIISKMPVDRLFFLLGYSDFAKGWQQEEVDAGEHPDLLPALAHAFARSAERALRQGVLQGYREEEEALPFVRGRIREADQLRRRYGLPLPVEVRYDEYDVDIAENQLLLAAAERLLRLPGVPPGTRKLLRHVLVRLAGVSRLVRGRPLPAWRRSRLNTRYHTALGLAELVLRGASYELDDGTSVRVDGLLVNMWRVFEDFLTAALSDALRPYGGRSETQDRNHHLDHDRRVRLRPDFVYYSDGDDAPMAVADAKYKIEKTPGRHNADLYQMLAYCTVLGLRHGHLIYAAGETGRHAHRVVGTDGIEIKQHALDLTLPPAELLAQIADLAHAIAPSERCDSVSLG